MEISDEVLSKSIDNYINRKIYTSFSLDDLQGLSDNEIEGAIIDYIEEHKVKDDYKNKYKIIRRLPKGMQYVYATWWLEGEVFNGGFNQYFYNSTGQFAEEALAGYKEMGANKMAQIVDLAIRTLIAEQELYFKTKKTGTLEAFSESYNETKLGECDKEYYNNDEDLQKLRITYIRNNLHEFIDGSNGNIKTWWRFWQ